MYSIKLVVVDFDQMAEMSDEQVVGRFEFYRRTSKKRLIPAKVRFDGYRVSRAPNRVIIHLVLLHSKMEIGEVHFVPAVFR
jgi:hypothetical protein